KICRPNRLKDQSDKSKLYIKEIANRLKDIILRGKFNNTLVCLPDVFTKPERYQDFTQSFYETSFFPNNESFLKEIGQTGNWYGSTFISRPYIDLVDKIGRASCRERE